MRTLKFRAWDKKRKRLYKVLHLHLASFEGPWATVEGFDVIAQSEVNIQIQPKDIELMQFTGLLDKNGKEIFEGDIIKGNYRNAEAGLVVWKDYGYGYGTNEEVLAGWIIKCGNRESQIRVWMHVVGCGCEIIGNIYESPELVNP